MLVTDHGDEEEFDSAEAAPPSNCTPDVKRDFYRQALIADIAMQSAKAKFDAKKGEYRSILKKASDAGVDSGAITNMLKQRFQDPDEVIREERARLEMYEISGFLPGITDILAPLHDMQQTDKEMQEGILLDAFDKGSLAGRLGRIHDEVNTYEPGTEAYVRFKKGYMEGQAAIAGEMKPRGRGRPRKERTLEGEVEAAEASAMGETEMPAA